MDHNKLEHKSEPARHVLKDVDHIITLTIKAPAPKKRFIRKNLEILFIIQFKRSLNEQNNALLTDYFLYYLILIICINIDIVEIYLICSYKTFYHWKWINKFEKLLLNKNSFINTNTYYITIRKVYIKISLCIQLL